MFRAFISSAMACNSSSFWHSASVAGTVSNRSMGWVCVTTVCLRAAIKGVVLARRRLGAVLPSGPTSVRLAVGLFECFVHLHVMDLEE